MLPRNGSSTFDPKLKLIQVVTYKQLVRMMKAKSTNERTQVNDILVMIVDEKKKKKKKHFNLISCMSLKMIDEHIYTLSNSEPPTFYWLYYISLCMCVCVSYTDNKRSNYTLNICAIGEAYLPFL